MDYLGSIAASSLIDGDNWGTLPFTRFANIHTDGLSEPSDCSYI